MFVPPKIFFLSIVLCFITVSVAIVCNGFLSINKVKNDLIQEMRGALNIISVNSAAALAFEDQKAAQKTLDSLRFNSDITIACLYSEDHHVFASFRQSDNTRACPYLSSQLSASIQKPYSFLKEIRQKGQIVGYIYLESDGAQVTATMYYNLKMASMLVLGTILFIGMPIAWRIQHRIYQPILKFSNDLLPYLEDPLTFKNSWMQLQQGIYHAVRRISDLTEENIQRKIVTQTTLNFLGEELAEKSASELIYSEAKKVGISNHNAKVINLLFQDAISSTKTLKEAVGFCKNLSFDKSSTTGLSLNDLLNRPYEHFFRNKPSNIFLHIDGELKDASPEFLALAETKFFDVLFSFLKNFAETTPDTPVYLIVIPVSAVELHIKVISSQDANKLTSSSQKRFLFFQLATFIKLSGCSMKIDLHNDFFCFKLYARKESDSSIIYEPHHGIDAVADEKDLYKSLLQNNVVISKIELDDKVNFMHLLSSITDCKVKHKLLELMENLNKEEIDCEAHGIGKKRYR